MCFSLQLWGGATRSPTLPCQSALVHGPQPAGKRMRVGPKEPSFSWSSLAVVRVGQYGVAR
eukprot:4145378-Alexandrium_andersonii.AAC.1